MTEEKSKSEVKKDSKKIAVILIRGLTKVEGSIKDTLFLLRLRKKHVCVVIDNNESNKGMIQKIKDYVTFGGIEEVTYKELVSKRAKKDKEGKMKPWFELAPPRGGFERKGIKKPFTVGGALGDRGDKINDLIKKMI